MTNESPQISNPYSTGGGGQHFEAHIQAMLVALMLSNGCAPCMPTWPIKKIKLQNKIDGYDTDDVMVVVEDVTSRRTGRFIAQIRHDVAITISNTRFGKLIQQAWNDFNNPENFDREVDAIALITGPLSKTDTQDVPWLLGQAKHTSDSHEFFRNVAQSNFSSKQKRKKLKAFRAHLCVSDEDLYAFLKCFHLLTTDLGGDNGLLLSVLHSYLRQYDVSLQGWIWDRLVNVVQTWNQNAGTITRENLPPDLVEAFKRPIVEFMPVELSTPQQDSEPIRNWNQHSSSSSLAKATLIGSWQDNSEADKEIIRRLLGSS